MKKRYLYGTGLITDYILRIFPEVKKELSKHLRICMLSKDNTLGKLASESIKNKKFHAIGGSVYALYPNVPLKNTVKFIVSFQTISDYLDNLCDSADVYSEKAFRQLHVAMFDALNPDNSFGDYYRHYPYFDDNGYLIHLVSTCKSVIRMLPSFEKVKPALIKYVELYTDLQSLKHLSNDIREKRLLLWSKKYSAIFKDISCWEFSAATGSTLGIFTLFASAWDKELTKEEVTNIENAYFPWICSLHILLDYYIDYQEDILTNQVNFTFYYKNLKHTEERLGFFIEKSFSACQTLKYPKFHSTIVKGLLAMYLSDPKAFSGLNSITSKSLAKTSGKKTVLYRNICKLLRFSGSL